MRLEIPSNNLSNSQKGKIIARNEKIPPGNLFFEISPTYAGLISNMYNAYNTEHCMIENDKIYLDRYVEWNALHGYEKREPATLIQEKYANGEIKLGDCIDVIFSEIQQLEDAKNMQRAQEEIDAKLATEKEKIEKPLREAREKKFAEEQKLRDVEEKIRKDAEAVKLSAEKEARRLARLAWTQEHGSEQLRKGLERGYQCIKKYEHELGRFLLGDEYEYDREDDVEDRDHACPSLEALEEAERLQAIGGIEETIVWLPQGLTDLHKDREEYNEPETGCGAVRVKVRGTSGYWYRAF